MDAEVEQEWAVIERWQGGDREAGAELLRRHKGLITIWVRRCRHMHLEADLEQEAGLALLHAAKQYDPARGTKLSTYAHWKVSAALQSFLEKQRPVCLPQSGRNERVIRAHRRDPDVQAEALVEPGMSHDTVESMLRVLRCRAVSVDWHQGGNTEDQQRKLAKLEGAMANLDTPEAAYMEAQARNLVAQALAKIALNARERQILQERLLSDTPRSLLEIGKAYAVSKQAAQVANQRLCTKLRVELAAVEAECRS